MKTVKLILLTVFCFGFVQLCLSQIDWEKYPSNPVLEKGLNGTDDAEFVGFPFVLFNSSTYHMWYNYGNTLEKLEYIGYATSDDGINWNKSLNNPVLEKGPEGSWEAYGVSVPFVLKLDTLYHMWYKGYSTSSLAGHGAFGHATSLDGIIWTKDSLNPVLDVGAAGEWDDLWLACPSVLLVGSTYHMWYAAWGGSGNPVLIGHATSTDAITWTRDPTNPVLSIGSSSRWDYPRVDAPNVIFDGSNFHIWFAGGDFFYQQIGYATSPDGTIWTKYENNPVIDEGVEGTWESLGIGFPTVLIDTVDNIYKMWYTGFDNPWSSQIGYATAPITDITDNEILRPLKYSLSQNYPNPFNPSTSIEFTLPKSEFVELKIYNILGKEVSKLVSDKLNSGNHTYQYDGRNLASGVYYYQLVAGDYREVKKMILLR